MQRKTPDSKRRILYSLCFLILSIILFISIAIAEGDEDLIAQGNYTGNGDTVTWRLDLEGLLTVEGSGGLTTNGAGWLNYKDSILRADITGSFQSIGTGVFKNCSQMTEITLPDCLTGIGYEAFYGCSVLESITFLGNVPSNIGAYAFYSCYKLEAFSIPAGVTTIMDGTFSYCSSLTEITIPESVESIGASAFYGCEKMESLTFSGQKLKSIGDFAFKGCPCLEEIDLPDGLTNIGCGAFSGCGMTEIEIPESVEYIDSGAFSHCESLTCFSFPTKIKIIPGGVLEDCYNLERVTLQEDTTAIAGYAFAWCIKLTDITIPDTVTAIGSHAFQACSCLTEIEIPDGVEEIRENTFAYCKKLRQVTVPDSVQSIGENAFLECESLEEIHIPDGVTAIERETFFRCNSLKEVYIPASVKRIGVLAFDRCESMTKVTFAEGSELESIGSSAFQQCLSIRELSIPDSVTSIDYGAFALCRNLREAVLPAGITVISKELFDSCSNLRHVVIPNGVTEIGVKAFKYCSFPDITIPTTVRSIGEAAFSYCQYLKSITIPDAVTAIEKDTFANCSGLSAVRLPNSLTHIGQNAFERCVNLRGIGLPDGLQSIGNGAFLTCWSIKDITIPNSVTSIGSEAFSGTWDMGKIYIPGAPESIAADAFNHEVTVYCHENTTAWQWADEQSYPIVLLDGMSTGDILSIQMEKNATILTGRKTGTPYSLFPNLSEVNTTWQSSNENVVTVDEKGLLTPVSVGTATITLTANGLSKSCMISVRHATEAILVPTHFYITEGLTAELAPVELQPADAYASLNAQYEDWTIASQDYSHSSGWFVKGLKAGETIMYFRDSYTGTTAQVLIHVLQVPSAVRLEPESISLRAGKTVILRPYVTIDGVESESTEYVSFRSSDTAVATVNPGGVVTALKEGTAFITVDVGSSLSASCEVTVRAAETIILPKDIQLIDRDALAGTGAELYIIPAGNQSVTIGEDAFAELTAEDIVVKLPANVSEIHPNAFRDSDVSFVAPKDSYAAEWAEENEFYCIEE